MIFAWEDLERLAREDVAAARDRLIHQLTNFAAFTRCEVVLVFDGYRVAHNPGEKADLHGLRVVYTREKETADMYIEKLVQEIGKNQQVRVVTSDALIQLSAVRSGVLRMSAREFGEEVAEVSRQIGELLAKQRKSGVNVGRNARITRESPDGKNFTES